MGGVRDIGHIILHVGDMDEALRFYCDALGFSVKGNVDPVWTVVSTEGGSLTLYRVKKPIPCTRADGQSPFNLHVADFEESSDALERAGCVVQREDQHNGSVKDPWGNLIGLHDHRKE